MAETKNYDAQFCGNLAIHQTNSIQDFGYLLIIKRETLEIIQGSENIAELVSKEVKDLIGSPLSDFLNPADLEHLKNEIDKGERNRVPFNFLLNTGSDIVSVSILSHVKEEFVILEIEKDDQLPERSFSEVFQEVRSFISTLEKSNNLQEICEVSIREIRRISGFDGIRMYQFDKEWNGKVVAEEITGELESYLGQTFPASDVPRQARALYIKNPFRLIPNREYRSYRLFPVINPLTNGFLDLSDCNLRSVAGVHLEYMTNMNVMASMSIRVMVEGALWGLISCHHISAKYLSIEHRSIFEWLSMEISYRISAVIKQEGLSLSSELFRKKALITENIYSKGDIIKGLTEDGGESLMSLFSCNGFAVSLSGKIFSGGQVPEKEELESLMLWAEGKSFGSIFASNELSSVYEEAKHYSEIASGILIIPINGSKGDFITCLRAEAVRSIKWGGDPNQAVNFEKDGLKYHPRNSFKLWLETVYRQSDLWTAAEIETAESLKNFLFEFNSTQSYN